MCHIWRREMVGILKERDHLGDKEVDEEGRIKMDGRVWTELIWLNKGTSSGLLWTRQ
jgi:hypothetical protein